jgi:MYXO-CTERM domain-containing protein
MGAARPPHCGTPSFSVVQSLEAPMKLLGSLLLAAGLLIANQPAARAHITLTNPKPRTVANSGQKGPPPCGLMAPNPNPQRFRPGETIMVEWDETVPHVGRFRVAFGEPGMTFPDPVARKDTSNILPIFIDGIDEKTAGGARVTHRQMITFPSKPCAACTLQVLQVMKVDPPYNPAANENIYYQCADIVLEGEPVGGGNPPPPPGPRDAGGADRPAPAPPSSDAGAPPPPPPPAPNPGTGGAGGSNGYPGAAGSTPPAPAPMGTPPAPAPAPASPNPAVPPPPVGGPGSAPPPSAPPGYTPPATPSPGFGCTVGGTPGSVPLAATALTLLALWFRRRRR